MIIKTSVGAIVYTNKAPVFVIGALQAQEQHRPYDKEVRRSRERRNSQR